MVSSEIIANEFVQKGIQSGMPVTQMKLQKMVFFAHGLHLALHGTPLIDESFYAWKFGPVIPRIYTLYKSWGSSKIIDTKITAVVDFGPKLSHTERETVEYTWEITKAIDGISLSNWSHAEGSPWAEAYRNGLGENSLIRNEAIKRYFEQHIANQ